MGSQQIKEAYLNTQHHLDQIYKDMLLETNTQKLIALNTMKQYYMGLKAGLEFASQFLWEVT